MQLTSLTMTIALIGLLFAVTPSQARLSQNWSYDDLVKASDLVAIVIPLKNEDNADKFKMEGVESSHFQGVSTTFRVLYCFKGGPVLGDLVVKHFTGTNGASLVGDGPAFIQFHMKMLDFEGKIRWDGESKTASQKINFGMGITQWLAFLKLSPDGSYVPVTGQFDANLSFRALNQGSLDQFMDH